MKWCFVLLGLVCVSGFLSAAEVTAPAQAAQATTEERYLFIVDTSASMQRLARESRQALFDLVYWGADGHMQAGDTFGIWSVDEEVHAGEFPMQTWRAEQQLDLGTKATVFLKDKTYRKQANYGKLSINLLSVVMKVKDANLFLITDAENPLVGLPLDDQIRQACAARAKERAAQHKPFIIYLSARGGEIRSATVAIAGETINLPPRSSKPSVARSRSATPTAVTAKKTTARNISLGYVDPEGLDGRAVAPAGSSAPPPRAVQPAQPAPVKPKQQQESGIRDQGPGGPTTETAAVIKSELAQAATIAPKEAAAVVKAELADAVAPSGRRTEKESDGLNPPSTGPSAADHSAKPSPTATAAGSQPLPIAARERQPIPVATAMPAVPEPVLALTARQLFIVSGALMLVTIGLVITFIKRLPRSPRGSAISKSMDDSGGR